MNLLNQVLLLYWTPWTLPGEEMFHWSRSTGDPFLFYFQPSFQRYDRIYWVQNGVCECVPEHAAAEIDNHTVSCAELTSKHSNPWFPKDIAVTHLVRRRTKTDPTWPNFKAKLSADLCFVHGNLCHQQNIYHNNWHVLFYWKQTSLGISLWDKVTSLLRMVKIIFRKSAFQTVLSILRYSQTKQCWNGKFPPSSLHPTFCFFFFSHSLIFNFIVHNNFGKWDEKKKIWFVVM